MTDLVIGNNATRQMSERTCFFLCFSFFIIHGIVSKVYSSIPPAALSSLHSPVTSNHHFCVFLFFFGWFHMIDSTMCNCFGNKSQEFTRTHTRLEKKEKKRKKKSIKKKSRVFVSSPPSSLHFNHLDESKVSYPFSKKHNLSSCRGWLDLFWWGNSGL